MCSCFTSNENCHFSFGKMVTPQNGLLIFLWKETHSETKSWTSSRNLRVKPNFFIVLSFHFVIFYFFSFFLFVFHFFMFFVFYFGIFLSFQCFSFISLFQFIFLHFSSFVFSFSFSFSRLLEIRFFKISCNISLKKKHFLSRLGAYLFGPSFLSIFFEKMFLFFSSF